MLSSDFAGLICHLFHNEHLLDYRNEDIYPQKAISSSSLARRTLMKKYALIKAIRKYRPCALLRTGKCSCLRGARKYHLAASSQNLDALSDW
ncbi:MAG: hypothetical protein J5855_07745 [Mailhella sp.]|nr:hypothetical protein [Mailhella sp.]